ncbi:hypothetical protein [Amycolatopsis orientalis]|uniref:hypothetical protein n=1 Tax=Amycolatopsis orientalis TaxID=31958 RepID=UPI0011AB7E63|nr:hypothetical protein [Amycolatopsis orientalis]
MHRDNAPTVASGQSSDESVDLWLARERFQAYLLYIATLLRSFHERVPETIDQLSVVEDTAENPVQLLADARAKVSTDSALAAAAVDAYSAAVSSAGVEG